MVSFAVMQVNELIGLSVERDLMLLKLQVDKIVNLSVLQIEMGCQSSLTYTERMVFGNCGNYPIIKFVPLIIQCRSNKAVIVA